MDNSQIKHLIADLYSQGLLSQDNKNKLRTLSLNIDQVRYMRNCAFDQLYQDLSTDIGRMQQQLKWLEQLIKTLDAANTVAEPVASAYFSPGEQCLDKIVAQFKATKRCVDICVFTIADDQITDAIITSHQRGIKIRIITDDEKALDYGSDINYLKSKGIEIKTDHSPSHMHHKFAIYDNQFLLNGSFNWTRSASRYNQENIIISNNKTLVAAYNQVFMQLWQQFS